MAGGSVRHHVERGAAEMAGIERGDERLLVDQRAARSVDEVGALFHLGEGFGVHQAARRRLQRRVHRDEIGARQQIVKAHGFDAGRGRRIHIHVRIVGEDFQSERFGLGRERARDVAEADEAEHLAFEPAQRHDRRHFPAAGLHELVGERHLAGERQQKRHGVVRDFAQAIVRHVIDGDADSFAAGRSILSTPSPKRPIALQFFSCRKSSPRKLGIGDEDRIGVARDGENVVGRRGSSPCGIPGSSRANAFFAGSSDGNGLSVMAIMGRGIGTPTFISSCPDPGIHGALRHHGLPGQARQ